MPIVAITAVRASSSGTPAATRAPKANSRMIRVIGRDVTSALPKSSWTFLLICSSVLASPNSPSVKPGCAACTSSTACTAGLTRSDASVSLPAISKRSSAACPSLEIRFAFAGASGLWKFWVWGTAASFRCTSTATRRNSGSVAVASLLWISTISWACSGAASAMAWSARPDSPTPVSLCCRVLVPTALPMNKATSTNASHPQIAVLRCCALHMPALDASPRGVMPFGSRVGRDAMPDLQSYRPIDPTRLLETKRTHERMR